MKILPLSEVASDPAAVADNVIVYAKDAAGVTKLYMRQSDGTIVEIGTGGGSGTTINHVEDVQTGVAILPESATTEVLACAEITPEAGNTVQITGAVHVELVNSSLSSAEVRAILKEDGVELAYWTASPGAVPDDGSSYYASIPITWSLTSDGAPHIYSVDILTSAKGTGQWQTRGRALVVNELALGVGGSGDRSMLPPQWRSNATLIPSSPNSPMGTGLTNTSEFRAIRPGSIVGLSTITEPGGPGVTGGTLTAQIAINGIPGTLTVVHTSGSNPEGGFATQAAGIDTYVAGDTIRGLWTTDAGFTPSGSIHLASWIQVEE